jgi:hypothetical protein
LLGRVKTAEGSVENGKETQPDEAGGTQERRGRKVSRLIRLFEPEGS